MVVFLQNEKVFGPYAELLGKQQREPDRWCTISVFNREDGLAGNAYHVGKGLLTKLSPLESVFPKSSSHGSPGFRNCDAVRSYCIESLI